MRVGIFDSGKGGLAALMRFKAILPSVDTVFFADEENAPYGNKTERELKALVRCDIERLLSLGAERILIACCTASTVYPFLPEKYRRASVPIIDPVARAAAISSRAGRIGVISTEATKRSGAFDRSILRLCPGAFVRSEAVPELVTLAERGFSDENMSEYASSVIKDIQSRFRGSDIDTLILGCTHFSYFKKSLEGALGVRVIDSAEIGAKELIADIVRRKRK